jgi:cycloeucalenol cycloisomerase
LSTRTPAWLSSNPDKAWSERAVLLGSIAWMAAVALSILTGWLTSWGELGYLAFSTGCMATVTLAPLAVAHRRGRAGAVSYLLKLNLFVAVLVFFGTYVGTHYFFDLMGMRYAFPTRFVFEAELVGKSGMHVPVFMYPLTQAYFMTYFTGLVIAERILRARLSPGRVGSALIVVGVSYVVAFAETFFMATDWMRDLFWYEKRGKMLALGSVGYALYFIVGLPLIRDLDERTTEAKWSHRRVLIVALAASMVIFFGLEAWAKIVGSL